MYLVVLLVVAIVEGQSHCLQCDVELSLYHENCCTISNLGKLLVVTDGSRRTYIQCPTALPTSCPYHYSCSDVLTANPAATSGYYDIKLANGSLASVYCNMEGCDGEGGWTRVAYLNMSDPSQQCPTEFRLYDESGVRACGRQITTVGCDSITFSTYSMNYSQVCGKVIGYQYASTDAFDFLRRAPQHTGIENAYVDGVSITYGSPRQHIWTFVASILSNGQETTQNYCPCDGTGRISAPDFVGENYFCESGNPASWGWSTVLYTDDPIWDGENCGSGEAECCSVPGIPYFHKILSSATTENIEMRICDDESVSTDDSPVSLYEIYIK